MNKVYLSGEVFEQPRMVSNPQTEAHLVFPLLVKHRSKAGVRKDLYRINAWNQCAAYCGQNLNKGMRVALQGYLSQRPIQLGEKAFMATEVAVNEIFLPEFSKQPADQPTTINVPGTA